MQIDCYIFAGRLSGLSCQSLPEGVHPSSGMKWISASTELLDSILSLAGGISYVSLKLLS